MKKNKLLIALSIVACSSAVIADDDITYSFSLKDWNHTFKQRNKTSAVNATILSATAKKGDYFATGSMFLPTTYSDNSITTPLVRRDADIALGWSFTSNFSLLGGYKRITGTQGNTAYFNIPYFGLNGFTSLDEKSFLYGTYLKNFKIGVSGDVTTNGTPTFSSYEGGYGYLLNKNTQLTVGYRSQELANLNPTTTLSGFIFGANFSF